MSEINQQLNALSQQQSSSERQPPPLQAAVVKPVQSRRPRKWALAGVCLVAITGSASWWLGTHASNAIAAPAPTVAEMPASAPGAEREEKRPSAAAVTEPQGVVPVPEKSTAAEVSAMVDKPTPQRVAAKSTDVPPAAKAVAKGDGRAEVTTRVAKPALAESHPAAEENAPRRTASAAATAQPPAAKPGQVSAQSVHSDGAAGGAVEGASADGALTIETVELDGEQLARVAYQKAEQALKSGDSRKAIHALREAVQYQPSWTLARQKLAALQYGRGETRQALATLQQGLALGEGQSGLRLTMAKLLVNESQPQAALNVLNRLPAAGHEEYLAMRGALAQQLAHVELAISSYQQLVKEQPYDGRWWMGLGIALEQSQAPVRARDAYQQALLMGRISQQSQQFIQQRLALLEAQEG